MKRPPSRQTGRRTRRLWPAACGAVLVACWMAHAAHAATAAPAGARLIPAVRPGTPPVAPPVTAEGRELAALHEQALRQLTALEQRLRSERDAGVRRALQVEAAEIKRTYWIRGVEVMLAGARRAGNAPRVAQLEALLRGVTSPRPAADGGSAGRIKSPDS